jgi:hypothetical protein
VRRLSTWWCLAGGPLVRSGVGRQAAAARGRRGSGSRERRGGGAGTGNPRAPAEPLPRAGHPRPQPLRGAPRRRAAPIQRHPTTTTTAPATDLDAVHAGCGRLGVVLDAGAAEFVGVCLAARVRPRLVVGAAGRDGLRVDVPAAAAQGLVVVELLAAAVVDVEGAQRGDLQHAVAVEGQVQPGGGGGGAGTGQGWERVVSGHAKTAACFKPKRPPRRASALAWRPPISPPPCPSPALT